MEKKKASIIKYVVVALLSVIVAGVFAYVCIKGDLEKPYFQLGCVALCFLLSLIFINKLPKKIFLTLALLCLAVADYFLIFDGTDKMEIWGTAVWLGAQAFLLIYSLTLTDAVGLKVIDVALRVASCLLIYFILPKYFTLETLDFMQLMGIANLAITVISALIHVKSEWFTLIALVIMLFSEICFALADGMTTTLKMSGAFVDFITKNNLGFYLHIPSILILAISSAFAKKRKIGM